MKMQASAQRVIRNVLLLSIVLTFFTISCGGSASQGAPAPVTPPSTSGPWQLVWSDDFNAANGTSPDSNKWTMETGGNGWGNNELETYTTRPANAQQVDGNLVITAAQEAYTGTDNITRQYTSARMKTAGKFTLTYGRVEARIKLPVTQGIWPAFWMLGNDIDTTGWPGAGEIDIMELIGSGPSKVYGTLHGPGYSGAGGISSNYTLPGGKRFDEDFHIFAIEWEPNVIRFYVDDTLYATRTPSSLPSGARWVFDHPFFIIMNVAVGGNWPGNPDASSVFPQKMTVDYVKVYSR